MTTQEREQFDRLLDEVVDELPESIRALLDEVPVIVLDRPTRKMLKDMGEPDADPLEVCGLHSGSSLTARQLDSGELPSDIHIFREGILDLAGGWTGPEGELSVKREIRITLLHEIGHEFGLDEEDLDRLGYA
jgi:predicted Zn-dependent protease with MMP-like domain